MDTSLKDQIRRSIDPREVKSLLDGFCASLSLALNLIVKRRGLSRKMNVMEAASSETRKLIVVTVKGSLKDALHAPNPWWKNKKTKMSMDVCYEENYWVQDRLFEGLSSKDEELYLQIVRPYKVSYTIDQGVEETVLTLRAEGEISLLRLPKDLGNFPKGEEDGEQSI
jgi:hypothetical protein